MQFKIGSKVRTKQDPYWSNHLDGIEFTITKIDPVPTGGVNITLDSKLTTISFRLFYDAIQFLENDFEAVSTSLFTLSESSD